MKLTYYSYYFKRNENKYRHTVLALLRAYVQNAPAHMKRSFVSRSGETIFIITNTNPHLFTLITTKNNELIKIINSDSFTYEDIRDDLEDNEKVGFASYIYVDNDHYAIASTSQGPKNSSFVYFIEQLLVSLSLTYSFIATPFPVRVSSSDVMTMNSVGRTTFEVSASNNAFVQFRQFFGGTLPDEIDAIEVTFKPRRGCDIKEYIPALTNAISGDGLEKYMVRAKESLDESLSDFYIAGNGFINDYLEPSESSIATRIAEKKIANQPLSLKLAEFRNDERYSNDRLEDIASYYNASAWDQFTLSTESGDIEETTGAAS
ncbi:hypothetical protein ACK3ZY_02110 [Aeromonas caviae]|uniref:hypothetical protein n=1 Tax=Aeromonas TaxID=642 RepID=UPI002B49FFE4|nr:hypothetical protein [Aeromonas caviae]